MKKTLVRSREQPGPVLKAPPGPKEHLMIICSCEIVTVREATSEEAYPWCLFPISTFSLMGITDMEDVRSGLNVQEQRVQNK